MSQTPVFHRYEGPNNIVIVPTVSFSKNVPTLPRVNLKEKDTSAEKVQLTGQNLLGEFTNTASIMSQLKSTPSIEDQTDVMCSIEYQLEQLMPTCVEPPTKPRETPSNEDVNKNLANVEDFNKTKKVNSWASNYLQSIGHNNLKPIKINPSVAKNKNQTVKTITAMSHESNKTVVQPTCLKETTSSYEGFNTTKNYPEFIQPNQNIISEHLNFGNIKTLQPANVTVCSSRTIERSEIQVKMLPVLPMSENITSTLVNSNIMLDTLHSNNNIYKASGYTTLLAESIGGATYCNNDGKREIDMYDAIKSKINHELAVEPKLVHSTINLPTHKKMCEDFINEISNNKASKSDKKKKSATKPETKLKNLVNKDKKQHDKESKDIKNQTSDKERDKKSRSSLKIDKSEKKERKLGKECQLNKNQQKPYINPNIDLKDYNGMNKHIFDKETGIQPESPERQKLKRIRANSVDLHNTSSGISTHTSIKSVVQVAENCQSNPPKRQCLDQSFDLRSKLSRINERIYRKTHMERETSSMSKIPKPRENLKITVEHRADEKQKSPKKSGVLKKSKKCKKLKLIINVVCHGSGDETTSSDSSYSETENNPKHNMDLSFLDDFNVDEIVDCLKHSPKHKIKSPLPFDIKMEDNIKRPPEPELKLATILNMLGAKTTETNKFKNPSRTDFMTEETMKNTSSTISNNLNNPSVALDVKISSLKSEENANNKTDGSQNKSLTTHALVRILSDTKLGLDQKKTASWEEGCLDVKCDIKTDDVINKNQEDKQASENNEKLIKDESVIIDDPEISIIDLTDETVVDSSETNNIAIIGKSNQCKKPNNENKRVKSVVINNIENNLKPAPNTHQNTNKENEKNRPETLNEQQIDVDVTLMTPILGKNEKIFIDLTKDNITDEIKSNLSINKSVVLANAQHKLDAETSSSNNTEVEKHEIITKQQEIHLIPLPNTYIVTSKENEKPIETKTLKDINNYKNGNYESKSKDIENACSTTKRNGDSKTEEIIYKDNLNKLAFKTNPCKIVGNDKTMHETNIKNIKEKPKESIKNIEINMELRNKVIIDNASKNNKKISKVFETKAAEQVIKNIVESVWGTKKDPECTSKIKNAAKMDPENTHETINDDKYIPENTPTTTKGNLEPKNKSKMNNEVKNKPENTSKINSDAKTEPENLTVTIKDAKTECKNTPKTNNVTENESENTSNTNSDSKNEPEHKSKMNSSSKTEPENTSNVNNSSTNKPENTSKTNNSVAKKVKHDSILTGENKALAVSLEKRMLEYLHRDIKIIRLIHFGKYSKIFSCKNSNGQTYAAKLMFENVKNRYHMGIKKEQILRKIQQDIPKENLNTVELIDAFAVEKYWCFLTEYYPKNLKQVLRAQTKPFHIDLVQDLARQLISAVMVLRNNGIVHSDIKPAHILINATHNRIKLCGFDAAFYLNNVNLLPNIGTANYRAPEIILGFSAGFSIDVWSSALVIYQMATNQLLFTGVYNNDILFKQMTTFGNLPMDMVEASLFKNQHFRGRAFMRRVGVRGQDAVLITKFNKTKRLLMSIMLAYNNHWATNNVYQRDADMFKLAALYRLLEQMLVLDPRWRIAIEFVCADPFIYEMFA